MPSRVRALLVFPLTLAFLWSLMPAASLGVVAAPKVVIIVGPTGAQTDMYRNSADNIADTATAAGADVTKVYSPNATWDNVQAAVNGANVIVYLGHGNGYPSPYSSTQYKDRVNGWGLNRTTNNGDSDDWSSTMVYCGEKALLGTLTSSDGSAQRQYCTGGIHPAPGFVMIYGKACYTPGASEGWDTPATEDQARERVRNYSRPVFALGGGAYFASDINAGSIVDLVLRNPDMAFGQIAQQADGYDASAQRHFAHEDVNGAEVWIQQTTNSHLGTEYWYAFSGFPNATPAGGTAEMPGAPTVTQVRPRDGGKWAGVGARIRAWFDMPVAGLDVNSFTVVDSYGFRVQGAVHWWPAQNLAVFVPSQPLVPKEWYTATLSSAIHSTDGVPMSAKQWTFRTKDNGDGSQQNWPWTKALTFKQGTHTGYRFDAAGKVTAVKTWTLLSDSGASTATRRLLPGQSGYWFYVTNGLWSGYWIRQSDALFLADANQLQSTQQATYDPPARIILRRGTHTGYRFDGSGAMTAEKTRTLAGNSVADATALQAIPNQTGTWFQVANGIWAGYWVRASDVIYLE